MIELELWGECESFLRGQVPAARRSLGSDHFLTITLNRHLATTLAYAPGRTRNDLRLNQTLGAAATRSCLNTGDDLLEAETILLDVTKRRRRVLGRTHPRTRESEFALSQVQGMLQE